MLKKILAGVLAVVMAAGSLSVSAFAETSDDYEYEVLENGTVRIIDYLGAGGNVVIPAEIDGKKVTEIGNFAFSPFLPYDTILGGHNYDYRDLVITKITIPEGVTTIDDDAFWRSEHLTSVNFPNSLTYIGARAFGKCESLTSIDLPNNLTYIGEYAFSDCKSLTSVVLPDGLTATGHGAFLSCKNLVKIVFPDSLTTIDNVSFAGCSALTKIVIPGSVTKIGGLAFDDCENLTTVLIMDGVTQIDFGAFRNCESLTSILIPASVTTFGPEVPSDWDEEDNIFYEKNLNNLTIYGYTNSAAQAYASKYNIRFVPLDATYSDIVWDDATGIYAYLSKGTFPGGASLSVKQDAASSTNETGYFDIDLTAGGNSVTVDGGFAVHMPFGAGSDADKVYVYYIGSDGKLTEITAPAFNNGYVTFTVIRYGRYVISVKPLSLDTPVPATTTAPEPATTTAAPEPTVTTNSPTAGDTNKTTNDKQSADTGAEGVAAAAGIAIVAAAAAFIVSKKRK